MIDEPDEHAEGGFFILARRAFEGWLWSLPPHQFKLAIWLIYRARWKEEPATIMVGGKPFTVARGEIWTTLANISKATGLSIKRVRTGLAVVTEAGLIRAEERAGLGRLIKVLNYERSLLSKIGFAF